MPFGVSKDFLDLARDGQRKALVGLLPLLGAALIGGAVAELLDVERLGGFVQLYASALAIGLLAGVGLGWLEIRSWGESLKDGWSEWMHSAVGAGTMGEAAERTGALRVDPGRVLFAALIALNAACLIAAWFTLPPFALTEPYGVLALTTVTLTGLAIGARASLGLVEGWWCREIEQQTLALVEEGRVGVWGIR